MSVINKGFFLFGIFLLFVLCGLITSDYIISKYYKLHDSEKTIIRYHTKIDIANITYSVNNDAFYFVVSWEHKGEKVVAVLGYSNLTLETVKAIFDKKYRIEANIVYDTETKEIIHVYHKFYKTIFKRNYPEVLNVKKEKKGVKI